MKKDNSFTKDINNHLKNSVYIVCGTTAGKDWVEVPRETMPDMIFYDSRIQLLSQDSISPSLEEYNEIIPFIYLSTRVRINNRSIGILLSPDDYTIKTFNCAELLKTIEEKISKDKAIGRYLNKSLNETCEQPAGRSYEEDDRIFIDYKRKPKLVKIGDITHITSKGNDSIINLNEMPRMPLRKTLNSWENILPINTFKRINRSTIINLKYVESISRWNRETYIIYLKDIKEPFAVSYRYAREMRSEFK